MIFSQYFGNYLLEWGFLSTEQLRVALERQSNAHVKLGVLAMDRQYMTADQVDEVRALQKLQDRRFGEIALERGFLTGIQLDALLHQQTPEHVQLAQVLIDMGVFGFSELEKIMEAYRGEKGFSTEEFDAVKGNDVETTLRCTLGMNDANHRRFFEYVVVFVKNLVRFIDSDVRLGKVQTIDKYEYRWLASQGIEGDLTMFTALSAETDAFVSFASRFANMQITEMDELAFASIGEFLNCQNGIFSSNLHDDGITVDLMPPEVNAYGSITSRGTLFRIPLYLGPGEFDLVMADFYASYEQ